jgi:tetratricopeptide (TPR) repeat protein
MPVHRVPGDHGAVFAYPAELDAWIASAKPEPNSIQQPSGLEDTVLNGRKGIDFRESGTGASAKPTQPPARGALQRPAVRLLVALAVFGCILLGVYLLRRASHAAAKTGPAGASASLHVPAPRAKDLYLKGLYLWGHRSQGSLQEAVIAFRQAVQLDPQYAEAYAGLAGCYDLMPEYTGMPMAEAFPRAIENANRALALNGALPEAHRSLAFALFWWQWDVPHSLAEFQWAIALNPNDVEAHHWYATVLSQLQKYKLAESEIDAARRLDPASRSILADSAYIRYLAGDREQAIAELMEMERVDADFLSPPSYLARFYFAEEKFPQFLPQFERAAALSKSPQDEAVAHAARQGWDRGGAQGMLRAMRDVQEQDFKQGKSSGYELAHTWALLGDREDAMKYLQTAMEAHDYGILETTRGDWDRPMRGYAPFEAFKEQVRRRFGIAG